MKILLKVVLITNNPNPIQVISLTSKTVPGLARAME